MTPRRSSRPPPSARFAGEVVAGRFAIERLAGAGGMGTVYRARDLASGQPVALKLLSSQLDNQRDRFERGARLLAHLDHPGVVRHVAHGVTAAGEPWLAMEWIEGEDLAQRLARAPLTIAESLTVVAGIARALAHAHAAELVHRDLKPSNVILRGGRLDAPVVLDFGLARLEHGALAFTRAGVLLGTPQYMAPEQARGASDLDARADVYALGCVLFECLTGRPPFAARGLVRLLDQVRRQAAPRVSDLAHVSDALDALVARMMAKQPAARPADGAAVVAALAGIGAGDDSAVRAPASSVPRDPALAETLCRSADELADPWCDAAHERTERSYAMCG